MNHKNDNEFSVIQNNALIILFLTAINRLFKSYRIWTKLILVVSTGFSIEARATCDSGLICNEPTVSDYSYNSFPVCFSYPCGSLEEIIHKYLTNLSPNYCNLRYEVTPWVESNHSVFTQYIRGASNTVTFYGEIITNGQCNPPERKLNTHGNTKSRTIVCSQGFAAWNQSDGTRRCAMSIASNKPQPDKLIGGSCDAVRNPISIGVGNKFEIERDIVSGGIEAPKLDFLRYYNSKKTVVELNNPPALSASLGSQWVHNFDYRIRVSSSTTGTTVFAQRENGRIVTFNLQGSVYQPHSDVKDQLLTVVDGLGGQIGWKYITAAGVIETYNLNGNILSISDRSGSTLTFQYSDSSTPSTVAPRPDLLISVSNPIGKSINFIYDSSARIIKAKDPAGGIFVYTYDGTSGPANGNNLTSVTYPNGQIKVYHYENTSYKHALTGITDENNDRFSTYGYDSSGRANSSEHAGTTEKSTIVYNVNAYGSPTTTVVTDPITGVVRTYTYTTVLGVPKIVGQSQPAGSGCAASSSALTYDANGNVVSRVDFNNNKTTYVYDLARNLETSRTEGLTNAGAATTATRTITTTWHSTWPLPLVISEYSGSTSAGTPLKRTTNVYDANGNITSYTEEDPIRSLSRTTTTTYTYSAAVPGLVLEKVVDGPRTGAVDSTTYTYYPHDAICVASTATPIVDPVTSTSPANLGCRGQLSSVVTPVGTTSYDRYNHHGQIEKLTDPNAAVTEFTYDLRQRLTSKTTGSESTQFSYDNAGLLVQTKFPDNSELNYVYDNAHRLTEISNTTGDKVVYILDSEGNRIQEEMYDPNGYIAKSLTRQFDALNRAQQVTGE